MQSLALLLVAAVAGCSFIRVRGPRDAGPGNRPWCSTTSYTSPIADSVGLGLGGLAIVGGLTYEGPEDDPASETGNDSDHTGMMSFVVGIVLAVPYLLSAYYGYATVADCREAQRVQRMPTPTR